MQTQIPLTRDLVLIGGGHTHALVLRKWGMSPLPGTRLTVINPGPAAPYSGMLPGHIAGHYTREELDIDLVRLARFAGARVIMGHATGIDAGQKTITVEGHGEIGYDVASIDIGITAEMPELPGFADHATGAKPLDTYASRWADFLDSVPAEEAAPSVAVIGAGIAGVELSMAMAHRLRGMGQTPVITLLEAGDGISGTSPATSRRLMRALAENNVTFRTGARITHLEAGRVHLEGGEAVEAGFIVGSAGAFPHGWLAGTGLPLHGGFIEVDPTLQVRGHDDLFAVGDCAHMGHAPRPKAGVFAVRAAPVLHDNLRAALSGGSLRRFTPQGDYLKLISLGKKSAMGEKWGRVLSGAFMWWLKDRIDRKFMDQFADYPVMAPPRLPDPVTLGVREELAGGKPLCGGCGSKVGAEVLSQIVAGAPPAMRDDITPAPGDDAAILTVGGQSQVITTDHLRGFILDPALMARITAVHALGDVWAMGAAPQAATINVILPRLSPALQTRTLREIMRAAGDVITGAGAAIVGGHTTMGAELTLGFTVTGLCDEAPITHAGGRSGDALLLTRPIGSGTLLAAEMAMQARGRDVAAMLSQMAAPQGDAARILRGARAMTDVTGFGLAGHLRAICMASSTGAALELEAIPTYDGAAYLAGAGHRSTLYTANAQAAPVIGARGATGTLLHDPQTAGGLLAAVAPDEADDLLAQLRQAGHRAARIGHLTDEPAVIRCR
ncbi:selenophosphate synthase [Salinihabitans flavidus]|uniref:Selenophosphate synthase n=1 Tax=Salinihabitans flavidus TaxID=569882 RepID=A0A1H8MJ51_9RHOB|nr:selenide, water dikinase SelD [Salinihabitans flavidus]SEO17304.1 selenophosphate synthase [Salinihabitans flavidus]